MTTEPDLLLPVLRALDGSLLGELSTTELRTEIRRMIPLTANDMLPLRNRADQRIDQIVRNIKCHRNSEGNAVHDGYLECVPRGFRITERGRSRLRQGRVA